MSSPRPSPSVPACSALRDHRDRRCQIRLAKTIDPLTANPPRIDETSADALSLQSKQEPAWRAIEPVALAPSESSHASAASDATSSQGGCEDAAYASGQSGS